MTGPSSTGTKAPTHVRNDPATHPATHTPTNQRVHTLNNPTTMCYSSSTAFRTACKQRLVRTRAGLVLGFHFFTILRHAGERASRPGRAPSPNPRSPSPASAPSGVYWSRHSRDPFGHHHHQHYAAPILYNRDTTHWSPPISRLKDCSAGSPARNLKSGSDRLSCSGRARKHTFLHFPYLSPREDLFPSNAHAVSARTSTFFCHSMYSVYYTYEYLFLSFHVLGVLEVPQRLPRPRFRTYEYLFCHSMYSVYYTYEHLFLSFHVLGVLEYHSACIHRSKQLTPGQGVNFLEAYGVPRLRAFLLALKFFNFSV